jgi:2-amino-4-hydroxy-6-hydroxymethyldihydropteridine diphosphokinase
MSQVCSLLWALTEMSVVYIGIGSNIGEREDNCLRAIGLLEENGVRITKRSKLHETKPWGVKDQPAFINMVVESETGLSPRGLLVLLKRIENDMGRQPGIKWGPRLIDLDILFYDDLVIQESDLTIPHPLMHLRDFVLGPLSEIVPEKVHPVLAKKISDLLCDSRGRDAGEITL